MLAVNGLCCWESAHADWMRLFEQIGEVVTTIPTIGFNVESVTYRNLNFNVWVSCIFSQGTSALEMKGKS